MSAPTTILRAGDLTPAELLRLLEDLAMPAGEAVRCWLDAPDGWALDFWRGTTGNVSWNGTGRNPHGETLRDVLSRVTTGRVFGPSAELKWRILPVLGPRCCRTVFLGRAWTSDCLEMLAARTELAGMTSAITAYPLWGQQTGKTPGEWIDLRIPHRLRYPVEVTAPARGRVIARASVEVWKDSGGEPQFLRLCELESAWEE
jgi:hypothetical protein